MRRVLIAALLAVLAAPALAADPVEGMWQTQPDDNGRFAHVRIYPCEDKLCGVLERAFEADGAPRKSDAVGKRMIWGMSADGGGAYSGGKIWAPDRDKVYTSKMQMSGDRLEVSGCVLGFCRGQNWRRLE